MIAQSGCRQPAGSTARPCKTVVLAWSCALALMASIAVTVNAEASTTVISWSPFADDGSLRPGLVASPDFGGDCYTGSFAVHGAYRCIAGNALRDPCFADPARDDAVVCVGSPFARGVVRLRVTASFDNSGSAPRGLVWAVRLANAQGCTFFAGGATSVDAAGRRANYGCAGRRTVLWGNPIRRGATWHIRLSHSFTPGPERLVAIRTHTSGERRDAQVRSRAADSVTEAVRDCTPGDIPRGAVRADAACDDDPAGMATATGLSAASSGDPLRGSSRRGRRYRAWLQPLPAKHFQGFDPGAVFVETGVHAPDVGKGVAG